MLIHSIDRNNRSCYIIQNVFAWEEPIRVEIFEAAWHELASRHEVLRSRFEWKSRSAPEQIVEAAPTVQFEIWQDVALEEFLEQDLERGFALSEAPPWRVTALRQPDGALTAVWTFHHLLLDGRSHIVLLRELLAIYDGLLAGRVVAGKPEVAHRHHAEWLQAQDFSSAEGFWTSYLKGHSEGSEFPKPVLQEARPVRYRTYDSRLGAGLTAELKAFSADTKFTIGNIIQASWAFVLGWLSNRNDVVIGTVRAARKSGIPGGEELIGLMINTMPLRVAWKPDSSIESVLKKVASDWNEFRGYEQTPLQTIQSWVELNPGTELFSSVLSYSAPHYLDAVFEGSEKRKDRFIWLRQTTPYCSLDASLDHDDLTLSLNLPAHLVDPGVASRLGGYLANTVRGVIADLSGSVSALSALGAEERARLIRGLNTRWESPPATIDWMERIRRQAEVRGRDEAIGSWDQSVSWAELEQRSNGVAAYLADQQVTDGAVVAVFLPRSPEFVWTCLGVMKAGAAYLPLDVQWPAQRIQAVLKDAQPVAILAGDLLLPDSVSVASRPIWDVRSLPVPVRVERPLKAPVAGQIAYVIYTSGSSGTPKGVEVMQGGLQNLIEDAAAAFDLGRNDRGSFISNTAFDASVHEIWPLLAAGASIHLPPVRLLADPAGLLRWMAEERIAFAFVSVIIAEALIQMAPGRASSLRYLLTGGDQLRTAPQEQLEFELVNEYGPTEYTVVATRYQVPAQTGGGSGIPIGKPLRSTRAYVMNQWQQLLPAGVAGELVLAGSGLARGYRHAPELTVQKFVGNPLPEEPGEKLYRTGDLVRWQEDGNLQFLGRIDSQVKLRGFRIELGEIEANLLKHPDVAEAVVVMKNDPAPRLVAFIVPGASNEVTRVNQVALKTHLAADLKAALPEYMVPAEFVFVGRLPVNSSGKYDRNQISKLAVEEEASSSLLALGAKSEFATPREAEMAAIWRDVLNVREVAPDDRFLSLGGTSLSIIRLICAIDQKFGAEIPATELFRDPTPGELMRFMEASVVARAEPLVHFGADARLEQYDQRTACRGPIFLIPGAGGGIHWFRDLADALAPVHTAVGVELLALSQEVRDHFSVERATVEIVELVRSYGKCEELSFCGYSGGGLIAIECARRLLAEGKKIGAVCLLDTYLPPVATGRVAQAERWLRGWWSLPVDRRIATVRERVKWLWRNRQETAAVPSPAQKAVAASKQGHIEAFKAHKLTPYSGAVDLFFAEDRPLSVGASVYRDWRAYLTGPLEVNYLPGDHYSLLQPHNARRLAEYFTRKLKEREASADVPSGMFT